MLRESGESPPGKSMSSVFAPLTAPCLYLARQERCGSHPLEASAATGALTSGCGDRCRRRIHRHIQPSVLRRAFEGPSFPSLSPCGSTAKVPKCRRKAPYGAYPDIGAVFCGISLVTLQPPGPAEPQATLLSGVGGLCQLWAQKRGSEEDVDTSQGGRLRLLLRSHMSMAHLKAHLTSVVGSAFLSCLVSKYFSCGVGGWCRCWI